MRQADSAKLVFNEGKACDAVIGVLERRIGGRRSEIWSPELDGDAAPIELVCKIGDQLFAFEHTGIEPFEGHVRLTAQASKHIDPIVKALEKRLSKEHNFELHIPATALQALKAREIRQVQDALVTNVVALASTLPIAAFARYITPIKKYSFDGVPFTVELHRSEPYALPGRFSIRHIVSNVEDAREARMREACERKFPKLAAWRAKANARTVLILEDNDIQLTNAQVVYEALAKSEDSFTDKPDEIYMVTTISEELWWVHALRVDGANYYNLSQAGLCMTEIDPFSLEDIMSTLRMARSVAK